MIKPNKFPVFLNQIFQKQINRTHSTDGAQSGRMKISILGAGGRVGQPLALLLKNNPQIQELALYDCVEIRPLAKELSHIDTRCRVKSFRGQIDECLQEARIVTIIASNAKEGDDDKTKFHKNAPVVSDLVTMCAKYCPNALIAIGTEPINSLVPVAAQTLSKFKIFDPNKLFGITTLNVLNANAQVAQVLGIPPENVHVPVIGGHNGRTIVPVLSHALPCRVFTNEELTKITDTVQKGACFCHRPSERFLLSGAFAIARFISSLCRGLGGEAGVVECCYVHSCIYGDLNYLVTPVELGEGGVQKNWGIPKLSDYEDCLMQNAVVLLKEDVKLATLFTNRKTYKVNKKESSYDCVGAFDVSNPC